MEKAKYINVSLKQAITTLSLLVITTASITLISGCFDPDSYSNQSLYPEKVSSVYVKMFENRSFYRGMEYTVTDALAKRIEAHTPYKIVSSNNRADTELTGQLLSVERGTLADERQTGRALEKEVMLSAVINWKNLKTGELLIDNKTITASAPYSEWQNQGFEYGYSLAANMLADKIVELMEKPW